MDELAAKVSKTNFPEMVHTEFVENIRAEDLRPLLQGRAFTAVLVGGGSPCQGNTFLNRSRKSLGDGRSQDPLLAVELVKAIRELPEIRSNEIPVIIWLENVASAVTAVKKQYSEWLAGKISQGCRKRWL